MLDKSPEGIRRYLEKKLIPELMWVVFEPNDEQLRSRIYLQIDRIMYDLFNQGVFHGSTPKESYSVWVGTRTTAQGEIDMDCVIIRIEYKLIKLGEVITLNIQQKTGQIKT